MSDQSIKTIRHSAAHILAQAVLQLYPDAKLGMGPAIENGFYYDFDLPQTLTVEDLKEIEKRMKKIIKEKQPFTYFELDKQKAIALMAEKNQSYKVEIINQLPDETVSFYQNGDFVDLCKGPHIEKTNQVKACKLLSVSGAYWLGSEDNKMLQRIYGAAFETKEELKAHLTRLEEAKKRDHRQLGKALDLFNIYDEVGGGLVIWHPKGAFIRHLIESYWKDLHIKSGYQLVCSPHIGKKNLWETSGHLSFYQENMYSEVTVENQAYHIKPMNCPFHIMVYNNTHHSYRELPIRYAELGTVYRYERSGTLHGLMRVRGFTQDDAHCICTPAQIEQEIMDILQFSLNLLKQFGFEKYKIYLSTRPEGKCVGSKENWDQAEKALELAMGKLDIDYLVDSGGGAFYGPKIDIKIEDAIGRDWQCSTIQFDFNLPERFNMNYVDSDGNKKRPYMIHRAIFGSLERFFGILIEHYAGRFPLWLAPTQVCLVPVNQGVYEYCEEIRRQLEAASIRVEIDQSNEKMGYKIRQGITQKIPYLIIIGEKEVENKTLSVRSLADGDKGEMDLASLVTELKQQLV